MEALVSAAHTHQTGTDQAEVEKKESWRGKTILEFQFLLIIPYHRLLIKQ